MNYDTCDGMTYTIKQGDTLYGISRKYDVPLAMILHANPYADVYRLNVGDTICIPMKKKCCKKPCSSGNRGISEDNDSSMNNGMGVENNIAGNLNVSDGMIETRRNKEMPDNMAGTRQSTGMSDNMTGTRQSWMIQIYSSVSVRSAKAIMSIVRITCLHISTSEEYKNKDTVFFQMTEKDCIFY